MDGHRRVAALDRRDRAAEADALAELRGERVGHELVPALEPEDLALEHGQAPALHDRRLPDAEQGRDLAVARGRRAVAAAQAVEADGGVRRAVLGEQLAGRDLVELVEPDAERLVLVADRVEVRPEVEERQLRPAAAGDEVDLPGVEPERAEDLRVLELRLGVPGAVDPPEHVDPARVGDGGEPELLDVLPVLLVAGPGEVLGPDVGVEPVRERVGAGDIGEPLLSFSQKSYKWGKSRSDSYRSRRTFPGLAPWVGIHAFDWLHWILGDVFTEVVGREGTTGALLPGLRQSGGLVLLTMSNGGVARHARLPAPGGRAIARRRTAADRRFPGRHRDRAGRARGDAEPRRREAPNIAPETTDRPLHAVRPFPPRRGRPRSSCTRPAASRRSPSWLKKPPRPVEWSPSATPATGRPELEGTTDIGDLRRVPLVNGSRRHPALVRQTLSNSHASRYPGAGRPHSLAVTRARATSCRQRKAGRVEVNSSRTVRNTSRRAARRLRSRRT